MPAQKNILIFTTARQKAILYIFGKLSTNDSSRRWIFAVPEDEAKLTEFNLKQFTGGEQNNVVILPLIPENEIAAINSFLKNRKVEHLFWFRDSDERNEDRKSLHRFFVEQLDILFNLKDKLLKSGVIHYLSSMEVGGYGAAVFDENSLEIGQKFADNRGEMLYLAEQKLRNSEIAEKSIIYRGGFFLGSKPESAKLFGFPPFANLKAVAKWPSFLPFPLPGEGNYFLPLTTVEFFEDLLNTVISSAAKFSGKTLHTADFNPYTLKALIRILRQKNESVPWVFKLGAPGGQFYLKMTWTEQKFLKFWNLNFSYNAHLTEKFIKPFGLSHPDFFDYYSLFI